LLCDGCDSQHHIKCVGLKEVPEGEWFCGPCIRKRQSKNEKESDKKRKRDEMETEKQRKKVDRDAKRLQMDEEKRVKKLERETKKAKRAAQLEGPKRPKNAFMFFTAERRNEEYEKMTEKSVSGVAKILGEQWKVLSAEERKKYDDMAIADKARYVNDLGFELFAKEKKALGPLDEGNATEDGEDKLAKDEGVGEGEGEGEAKPQANPLKERWLALSPDEQKVFEERVAKESKEKSEKSEETSKKKSVDTPKKKSVDAPKKKTDSTPKKGKKEGGELEEEVFAILDECTKQETPISKKGVRKELEKKRGLKEGKLIQLRPQISDAVAKWMATNNPEGDVDME